MVWIGKYWLGSVNIGLDWLCQSRSVNISLDGLNVKEYQLISVRIGLYQLKCWLRLTNINQYLDRIILTNYWLRMTKTEYVEYGIALVKHQLAGSVKHRLILVNFF